MRIRMSSSMIIPIIDPHGVPVLEFKNHAPVFVDPNGTMIFQFTFEQVQSPSGQVHVPGSIRRIQLRQLQPQPFRVGRLNPRLASRPEERFKPLVLKRFDHGAIV